MFHKDTLRLIRKSFNRFFSLLMIVLIGAAFMMGLLSSRAIMEESVDEYNDKYALHDIQFYSSYGFCDEDVEEIAAQDSVERVFASRFADVLSIDESGTVRVTRAEEYERSLDKFELIEGRFPQNNREALVLDVGMTKGEHSTDETLKLFLEDGDIKDTLEYSEFKVVGIVKTPTYMAKTLGASTLQNRDLELVIYIPMFNFRSEYYTTVYAALKDAAAMDSFSKEYDGLVTEAKDDLGTMAAKQQEVLKDKLLAEYREKISEGEKELEEKRTEGQAQLDEAKQKLDDANIQIISGEAQINTLEAALDTLLVRQRALEKEYNDNAGPTNAAVEAVEKETGIEFSEALARTTTDYATYGALKGLLEEAGDAAYADQIRSSMESIDAKYAGGVTARYEKLSQLSTDKIRYDALKAEIDIARQAEQRARDEIGSLRYRVRSGRAQYEQGMEEYKKGLAEFTVEIEKAELEIRKAYQELDELPDAKWMILDRDSHYSSYLYVNNCKQMGAIGIALPVLFFLVAALVCLTTMTRLVDEQRGQIGIFRALGFSRGQIVSKYVGYALSASLIGSVTGIFVGMAIFPVVIYETWRLMYDLPDRIMALPPLNIVISVLSFAVLIAAVTSYVVNKSLREQPSQLMRPKAPKNAKKVILEKIPLIWNRLSFTGKITARNLIRYKARALMTIIGVAGCTGLLVVGWGIKDSIRDIVAIQFGQLYNYDYTVNMEGDERIEDTIKTLEKDETNEACAPYMTYTSKAFIDGEEPTINVVVMDARDGNDMLKFREASDKSTPVKIRNSGVIISEKFAKNNGIKEGDTITIESASGLKAEVKVNAVFELYFQHYMYMSEDYYESVFDEQVHYNSVVIRNSEKSAAEIEDMLKGSEGYESIMDFTSLTEQFNNMIKALDYIILVVVVTAGALAFVVLINLTQVNISERIREIATLKVLGFHNAEVDSYLFKEILLLALAGALIGLPLGRLEHHFIMNVIQMEMIMFGQNVNVMSYVMAFGVTLVFTGIVLLLTKRPIKRVQMVESLKSVE